MLKEILDKIPEISRKDLNISEEISYYEPKGCKRCGSGYSGRVGIYEVLEMTKELSELILTKPSEADIKKEADRQGMITMKQDGILKVLKGLTSIEEVLRVAEEK